MADPLGSLEKIVKLALRIKEAVDTVRHNREECQKIRTRAVRVSSLLSRLPETGITGDPAMCDALGDLEDSLHHAHALVTDCQQNSTVCLYCTAGKQARRLRRAQDDISQKVMLVVFATNIHTTIVLTNNIRSGDAPPAQVIMGATIAQPVTVPFNSSAADDASRSRRTDESSINLSWSSDEDLVDLPLASTLPPPASDALPPAPALLLGAKDDVDEEEPELLWPSKYKRDVFCPVPMRARARASDKAPPIEEKPELLWPYERVRSRSPFSKASLDGAPSGICLPGISSQPQAYEIQRLGIDLVAGKLPGGQTKQAPSASALASTSRAVLTPRSRHRQQSMPRRSMSLTPPSSVPPLFEDSRLWGPILHSRSTAGKKTLPNVMDNASLEEGAEADNNLPMESGSPFVGRPGYYTGEPKPIQILPPPPPPRPRHRQASLHVDNGNGHPKLPFRCSALSFSSADKIARLRATRVGHGAGARSTARLRFTPDSSLRDFSFSELEAATHQFSVLNMVGSGSFATVYKGVLHDGLLVAVKKFQHPNVLSAGNINVLHHISKLKHENIVKLIGYSGEVHEKAKWFEDGKIVTKGDKGTSYLLVEEYMPNGSLDKTINGLRLDWSSRFRLIQGIADGLCYLHKRDVIHLDLKPSNILLDSDMNPKITDFGIAKVLNHKVVDFCSDIATIEGTLGYMPPEYITDGRLSKKHDVYGFGVTLLDTVSSMSIPKRSTGQASIEWAWQARQAGGMMELLDRSLFETSQLKEIERCIEVGLLCTQFDPAERPDMLDALKMLRGEKILRTPVRPGYTNKQPAESWLRRWGCLRVRL